MPQAPTLNFAGSQVSSDRILVQLAPGSTAASVNQTLIGIGHVGDQLVAGSARQGGLYAVTLDNGAPIGAALSTLSHLSGVAYAEPDYVVTTMDIADADPLVDALSVSNDPGFTGGQTWGMYGDFTVSANAFGSQAGEAWAANYTGSTKVAAGVVDTGVDYTHPDLYLNIWLNPGEIPTALRASLVDTDGDGRIGFRDLNAVANAAYVTDLNANGRIDAGDLLRDIRWENGVDEDANGYLDDLIGWDFINNDNDPMDDVGHGTHVAGIIAAQGGNGVGVAGVVWSTQIVVAKFLGPNGGFTSDAIRALDYVTAATATTNIVATNNSWGGGGASSALAAAITRGAVADILFVAAAGNGGADQIGDNNDGAVPNYPSNYSTLASAGYEAVIAVAALTSTGALASYSNYGPNSVDIGAPGSSIYSTLPNGGYGLMSGTSMATPFVTGAILAYASAHQGANAATLRTDLLAAAQPTSSLAGRTATGGRLDVSNLLYRAQPAGLDISGTLGADTFGVITSSLATKATVFDDTLSGLDGDDKLDGGPGADRLVGGAGNDTYTIDRLTDVVIELSGEGNDLINSPISLILPANVERLTLTGSAATSATGNDLANTLTGNAAGNVLTDDLGADTLNGAGGADTLSSGAGNDRLIGGSGVDSMSGGVGDDTYDVDVSGDIVWELAGQGNDLVNSKAPTYTLPANVERLTLTSYSASDGNGNASDNTLTGNTAANRLFGDAGADTLSGGTGDDTLDGGAGVDRLTGGAGLDHFIFHRGEATGDTITDFAGGDIIELQGYGAGSTLASVGGSTTDWRITDGVTGATEIIVLSNHYVLATSDFLFT